MIFYLVYSTTLEKDISSDTSRDLKKILLGFLDDSRPESNTVNEDQAESDAQALYKAGEKKWGTDEKVFVEIISTRRFLREIVLCENSLFNISSLV